MFGFMRIGNKGVDQSCKDYQDHRNHYCGTCQTLGVQYGQASRTFLNFDTVFLAELLGHLAKDDHPEWAFTDSLNGKCLQKPEKDKSIPFPLAFAAATTVLLSECKLADHNFDQPGIKWRLLHRSFSKTFRKAHSHFINWGIDIHALTDLAVYQQEVERIHPSTFTTLEDALHYSADPTAQITGFIFQQGARISGQNLAEGNMYEVGYAFGRLAYMLDAFEDIEVDLRRGQFNPIALYFGIRETPDEYSLEQARNLLVVCAESMIHHLEQLPIPKELQHSFAERIRTNLALRSVQPRKAIKSVSKRIQFALKNLIEHSGQILEQSILGLKQMNAYMVSLVLLILPWAVRQISPSDQGAIYLWMGILTVVLGMIGLGRHLVFQGRGKRIYQSFLSWIRRPQRMKEPCLDQCIQTCCEACCSALCDHICRSVCNR